LLLSGRARPQRSITYVGLSSRSSHDSCQLILKRSELAHAGFEDFDVLCEDELVGRIYFIGETSPRGGATGPSPEFRSSGTTFRPLAKRFTQIGSAPAKTGDVSLR